MRRSALLLSLLFLGFAAAPPALAGAPGGDPALGAQVAAENCGACHATGRVGDSPIAHAPQFRTLGERWELDDLAEALAEGMVVGHSEPQMPAFRFLPSDIDDLIAYLESIQER